MASKKRRRNQSSGHDGQGGIPIGLAVAGGVILLLLGVILAQQLGGGLGASPEVTQSSAPPEIAPPQSPTMATPQEQPRGPAASTERSSLASLTAASPSSPDVGNTEAMASAEVAATLFEKQSPPAGHFLLGISTNVVGSEAILRDMQSDVEVERFEVNDGNFATRIISQQQPVRVVLQCGKQKLEIPNVQLEAGQRRLLDVSFDKTQLQTIRKSATCLIMIPDGGFGSGFIFEDRQTIGTAAHCVVAEHIGDLEFVFDPTEPTEERFKGAKLMHFDAKQDIALLRLPEPLPASRPFLFRGPNNPETDQDVVIIGNPGRAGKFDPTYSRSGKVAGGRVDEFYVDLELKPGFSGGPVCAAESNEVLGLVSFKIVRSADYTAVGRSFAKSADLIGDAHEHFSSLSTDSQQTRIQRLETDHDEQYVMELAGQAAVDMYLDSSVYLYICWTVAVDYIRYTAEIEAKMSPTLPLASRHRALKAAHGKYIWEEAPKIAGKVRDKVSPKLRMAESHSYERAIANPQLTGELRERLESAHKNYASIRQAAEQIVESSSSVKGRTLDEFLEWATDLYRDTQGDCLEVMARAGVGFEE